MQAKFKYVPDAASLSSHYPSLIFFRTSGDHLLLKPCSRIRDLKTEMFGSFTLQIREIHCPTAPKEAGIKHYDIQPMTEKATVTFIKALQKLF